MLANIFFLTLNHVSNQIPLVISVVTKFFVVTIAFTGFAMSQDLQIGTKYVDNNILTGIKTTTRQRFANDKVAPKLSETYEMERKAFDLLNLKRLEKGAEALVWSDNIAAVARLHSTNMANYKFFSHSGLDGLTVDGRADSLGFKKWRAIGENIAYNRGFDNPVEFTVERWMLSDSHRQNLLDKRWKEAAVGVAKADDGTYYFTEVFMCK